MAAPKKLFWFLHLLVELLSQGLCDVGEVLLVSSQERSCENKIPIYAAFEGRGGAGGRIATKWPRDVFRDQYSAFDSFASLVQSF